MPKSYLSCTLIVIFYACFTIEISEGCNRQHTEPYRDYVEDYEDTIQYNIPPEEQEGEYPSGIDYPTPPPEYETTTRRVLVHRALCRMEEEAMMGCLNRGTCVVLELNVRRPVCECPLEFRGSRCQYRSPRLWDEVRQHRLRTAHVAAGVSVCILLVFVLILAIYVYIRYRRKNRYLLDHEFEASAEELCDGPDSIGAASDNHSPKKSQFSQQQYNGTGRQGTRTLHPSPQRKSHVIANVSTRGGVKSSLLGDEDNTACVVATDEKCALDLGRCHNNDTGDRHVSHSNGSHGNITSPTDSTTRCASGV